MEASAAYVYLVPRRKGGKAMVIKSRRLIVETLTPQEFAAFGEVIEIDNRQYTSINNGLAHRYHKLATADVLDEGGEAIISIFKACIPSFPLIIDSLERHPLGSQAFIPLLGNPFLILVAPKGDSPKSSKIRAFVTNGRQGVNYFKGVWHFPLLALVERDQLLVIDRDGVGDNCETKACDGGAVELHKESILLPLY